MSSPSPVVICDASPLIFLGKLGELELIREVLKASEIVVLQCVVDEVLSPRSFPAERIAFERFLRTCRVVDFHSNDNTPSEALSQSERASLSWAVDHRADWMVVDERLLRRCAVAERIRVVGFLGLLVSAAQSGLRDRELVRRQISAVVTLHGCRISTGLYATLLAALDKD